MKGASGLTSCAGCRLLAAVSKRCPSSRAAQPPGSYPVLPREAANCWRRRVFHNTYTRNGRRIAVRGWSVKIQYQGKRRTFSLAARTRAAAALEAQIIHNTLSAQGWEALAQPPVSLSRGAFQKTDTHSWRERLLLRKNVFPGGGGAEQKFFTRIDHAGVCHYFPLGLSDPNAASARALSIYGAIVHKGWETVLRVFSREVCLAFRWAYEPLLWTYTTVHTFVGGLPRPPRPRSRRSSPLRRVLLVEPELGLREALAWCIEQHKACTAIRCADAAAARYHLASQGVALCLVNVNQSEALGLSMAAPIATLADGPPALTYSMHADSDEVFLAVPGGISSYLLKRLPPHRIFEPIGSLLESGAISSESFVKCARAYFQRVLETGPLRESSPAASRLTQREQEVLTLLSKGYVDKEIASALGISPWTVHGHVKRIFEKLHVHSRIEAVLAFFQK